jgi:hypothetical protein
MVQVELINLHAAAMILADDYKIVDNVVLYLMLTKPTRKQRLEKVAEKDSEEPAFEALSGEKLLVHIKEGGSLRNEQEKISADRLVDRLQKRIQRGKDEKANKDTVMAALQARRMETAPGFVDSQEKQLNKLLGDFRAGGRALASGWQKATTAMQGLAKLTEECWEREPLAAQPAKRFKGAVAKEVPGPLVDEDSEE